MIEWLYPAPPLYPGILLKQILLLPSMVSCSFEAIAQGLEVLPCRFEVTLASIRYLGLAQLKV